MKRLGTVVLTAFAVVLLAATSLVAANAHFIGSPKAVVSGQTLTVSFKAAGLGNAEETATFNLSGEVDVFSRCYNRGGNKPQADNKQETLAVDTTSDFPVRNGQVTGSFTVTPLSTLDCPGNQRVVIESVDFSDLVLSGEGLVYEF